MKKLLCLLMFIITLMSKCYAKDENDEYVLAGKYLAKTEYYIFLVTEVSFSSSCLETVQYENFDCCIRIDVSDEIFEKNFSMDNVYTIRITDENYDGIYEIDNNGKLNKYLKWNDMASEPYDTITGYFIEDCGGIEFHNECFNETNVYKFQITSTKEKYPKYSDFVYMVYEKNYFENNLSYDKGYSFLIFETGEQYKKRDLYFMYDMINMKYFDYFCFHEFDKEELIETSNNDKNNERKEKLIPMLIVVSVIVAGGILYKFFSKSSWKNKKSY